MEAINSSFAQSDFDRLNRELFLLESEEMLDGKDNSNRIKEIKDILENPAKYFPLKD